MEREDVILDMVARKDRSDKVIFNTVYGVGGGGVGGWRTSSRQINSKYKGPEICR